MATVDGFDGMTEWTEDFDDPGAGDILSTHTYNDADVNAAIATAVATETTNRTNAVNAEALARANADTAEATARSTADTNEANARIAGDATAVHLTGNETIAGTKNFTGDIQQGSISLPRGTVAIATPVVASISGVTSADVGNTFPATLVAGRRYKLCAMGPGCFSTVLNDIWKVQLMQGGVILATAHGACGSTTIPTSTLNIAQPIKCVASGASATNQEINAGSYTFKVNLSRSAGTGTLTLPATTGNALAYWLEDIGV